jgi:hypothetical protein
MLNNFSENILYGLNMDFHKRWWVCMGEIGGSMDVTEGLVDDQIHNFIRPISAYYAYEIVAT